MEQSSSYNDAYRTEDYDQAIQFERRALILMTKTGEEQVIQNATVKGLYLIINNERYNHKAIPEYLN